LDRLGEIGRGIFGDSDPKPPKRQQPTVDDANNGTYATPSNASSPPSTKSSYRPPTYQTNGNATTVAVQQPSSSASIIAPPVIVARPPQPAMVVAAPPQPQMIAAAPSQPPMIATALPQQPMAMAPTGVELPPSGSAASSSQPSTPRLYERLLSFRDSAFGDSAGSATVVGPAVASPGPSPQQSAGIAPTPDLSSNSGRSVLQPPSSPAAGGSTSSGNEWTQRTSRPEASADLSSGAASSGGPSFAEPTLASPRPKMATASPPVAQQAILPATDVATPSVAVPGAAPANVAVPSAVSANVATPSAAAADTAAAAASSGALFTKQSPVLDVKTVGPRKIMVGRESTYEVVIRNSGQVAADEVTVTVDLPAWADVQASEPSAGAASPEAGASNGKRLLWKVGRLEGRGQEKLALRIVPRQSRPFDLAVKWDYASDPSQAMIEVQEPKLQMRLDGPKEVLFGEKQIYRLELSNAGSGDAEGVEISLLPLGSGDNQATSHRLGGLPAGGKKVIDVELTARQTGALTIKMDARSDGGFEAHLAEQVLVRRAELKVDVEAPKMQFVGAEVGYKIHVHNAGNAAAKNVKLAATLPPGVKYVAASKGGRLSQASGEVSWTLAALPPDGDENLTVTCILQQSGPQRLQVASTAEGELAASGEALIQVEAVADLRLEVIDPAGPVAVDAEAAYEIHVRNRGTKSAEEIDVVVYFSQGVEPTAAEGSPYKMAPGQVVFDRISSISAGKMVALKVRAKAQRPGNHVFRTEVYCKPLDSRLVSEQTTHFYGGTETSATALPSTTFSPPASLVPPAAPYSQAPPARPWSERTADRRSSTMPPLLPPPPLTGDASAPSDAKPMPVFSPR
jgi:uncharacterized repeat protein (TIGR01451 family)